MIGRNLEMNDDLMIKWYIDAAFAVHVDMKSISGCYVTLGKGGIYCNSRKQKFNTRSSTEAELVGVDDYISEVLWYSKFLKSQGVELKETVVQAFRYKVFFCQGLYRSRRYRCRVL